MAQANGCRSTILIVDDGPAHSHEKAAPVILAGRGTHFGPVVVEAFVEGMGEFEQLAHQFADSGIPQG